MKNKLNYKIINLGVTILVISLILVVLNYIGFFQFTSKILISLMPFYIGFLLSWLLLPFSKFMQKKLKFNKTVANIISLFISIILILLVLFVLIPLAFMQSGEMFSKLPNMVQEIIMKNKLNLVFDNLDANNFYKHLVTKISKGGFKDFKDIVASPLAFLGSSWNIIVGYIYSFITFLTTFIAGYIVAFYFMGSIKSFVKAIIRLVAPVDYKKYEKIVLEISNALYDYFKGMLLVCLGVGIMMLIGTYFIGIKTPFLFAIISALTNVIPYFGPIIGGIPLFISALALGPQQAVFSIILIMIVQFIESQFFQPKIMSNSTNLHPVTIMVSLFIFSSFFGIIGMIISTPIVTVLNVLLKHTRFRDKIHL